MLIKSTGARLFRHLVVGATLLAMGTLGAGAQEWRMTDTMGGASKYGKQIQHYDHVSLNAPKGGTLNTVVSGTYDSFNPFIVTGTTGAGLNYQGGLLWDTLMAEIAGRDGNQPPADSRSVQISG
jgi:microcin C transport system substrate-binding protein